MFSWARAMLRVEEGHDTTNCAEARDRVTRQEIVALFADDLAHIVLQKRTISRGLQPQRFMAERQNHSAK